MVTGYIVRTAAITQGGGDLTADLGGQGTTAIQPAPGRGINRGRQFTLQGELATPIDPPPGCRLYGRCPLATEICGQVSPPLSDRGGVHYVACHHV